MVENTLPVSGKLVFVIGDVMLDRYIYGEVNRTSPEAPVPVLEISRTSESAGGAANVALNMNGLNIDTLLISMIGNDESAQELILFLNKTGLSTDGLLRSSNRKTTEKIRLMSGDQHLLRMDNEDIHPLSKDDERSLWNHIQYLFNIQKPDVIVLQDYNKGVLTPFLITSVLSLAKKWTIPVAVDPKDNHFWAYRDVSIFKPNRREIQKKIPFVFENNVSDLKKVTDYIFSKLQCNIAVITLGENGVWLANQSSGIWIKGVKQEIIDVCGAGDAVIASLVWALLNGYDLENMGKFANAAGLQACCCPGVTPLVWNTFWPFYLNLYTK
ncbi:MAG: bifunctional heptose 7-phosphate kinase/heptose 1-phosphate adenyltransferase [Bacteroidota bacterium]